MRRPSCPIRVSFLAALVLTAGAVAASPAAADNKCTIALKGDNPIVKACQQGGIKEAKSVMKKMQLVAKDKGKKFACDGCHKNVEDFKLSDEAEKRFKELLALQ